MKKDTQKELIKIVEKNYNEIAELFNETRKKQLWPELLKLTKKVKDGDKVLDVGCGNGRLLQAFADKNIKYLGTDLSENLIKIAQEQNPQKNAEFKTLDMLDLGKLSEINFDYVFSIAVLHHIPGSKLRISALKQMKNKIKPDGRIVLTNWNMWSPVWTKPNFKKLIWKFFALKLIGKNKMDFGDVLFDWKNTKGERTSKRYYHAFTAWELKKLAKKAGLKIEKLYKDKYNYYLILKK